MTSSKSFRATILPSSLSFSSFRSNSGPNSDPDPDPDPEKQHRRKPWQKASLHLPRGRKVVNVANESPAPPGLKTSATFTTSTSSSSSATQLNKEEREASTMPSFPSRPQLQKSNTWGTRAPSLIPVLTPKTPDSYPQPIQRKPIGGTMSPPLTTPPPPPYVASEADDDGSSPGIPPISLEGLEHTLPAIQQPDSPPAEIHTVPPLLQSEPPEIPEFSFSFSAHQPLESLDPIPSPREPRHAKLTKQEPTAQVGTRRGSAAEGETESQKQGKLQKENRKSRSRSSSLFQPKLTELPPSALNARQTSPVPEARGRRSISAQAQLAPSGTLPNVRSASAHDGSQSPTRGRLRRSWLPGGGRSRSNSVDVSNGGKSEAWVMSDENQAEYNPVFLRNAEKVPELWNENGNIYVYLYPRGSGCGPSFKVPEFVVGTSYVLNELLHTEEEVPTMNRATAFGGRDSLSVHDANRVTSPPIGPPIADDPNALRLYLPAAPPTASAHLSSPGEGAQAELDRLIAIRNLFAFLTGQPLVGTKTRPTMFHAFVELAGLLQEFGFSSPDGSNFGEAVELSFGFYSEQLGLSDCRHSREKTIEALILGERMRSVDLYNEAFAHAAGKYSAIIDLRLSLFEQVSPLTRQRLERAHLDLVNRQHNVNEHLEQFDFPSLFAGIANSTSIPELRQIRFKTWRNSFSRMRQFLLGYYKSTFGSWPPKASNKKNPFAESGLNRLVLKVLYSDMCALYDLLVDRASLTSRVMDEVPAISEAPSSMTTSALRNMLSEFDRSKPPVLPPIPFDLPQLPSMKAIHETFDNMSSKDQNRMEKKIKEHELILILNKAYNFDTNRIKLPFLEQFKEFEIREGRGKMTQDLVDQRIGCWLFLYAVLQSLPMLVVDAPGVRYTEGVEYFLCEPPMGNLPWVEDRQVRKMWYEVTGGGGIVELSADAVMFSVEATYHRSHCWLAAKQWEGFDGADAPPPEEPPMSPLHPPAPMFPGAEPSIGGTPAGGPSTPSPPPGGPQVALRPRNLSPAQRSRQFSRSSIAMGLEPVPLEPPPNAFGSHNHSGSIGSRPASSHLGFRSSSAGNLVGMAARGGSPAPQSKLAATSGATFDDILGESSNKKQTGTKKKGRFF
ncbi:hypothetical protein QQS21_006392 [Conoideocrella luteorostrata]|uniref:DUF8004 domain-containing protein n=1 Tax=Conoideocrella luteorostrata TaxID=1105319 RepID=A0AAJ0FY16_9HYPO|nr:hypothetical protein QQS21_006392 [Conoideocrella luteorostrata]